MVSLKATQINHREFTESSWQNILDAVKITAKLSHTERDRLKVNPVAKLVAALPYMAGCRNPDQLAVLKLGMYIAGTRNPQMFAHRDNQTIRERILPGVICPDGDKDVMELVTNFLELISINDHIHDYKQDLRTGHPNPVGKHILFYFSRRDQLRREIENAPHKELLERLKRIVDPVKCGYWDYEG